MVIKTLIVVKITAVKITAVKITAVKITAVKITAGKITAVVVVITTANSTKPKMVQINIGTKIWKNPMIQILGKHAAIGVVGMKKPEMILHHTQTQGAAPNTNYIL